MEPTRTGDGVRVGGDARQRLHHARGYGEPVGQSDVLLSPVEAAYLLYRDDIPSVDGMGLEAYLREEGSPAFLSRLLVYKDLRERGFYLSIYGAEDDRFDFVVFERGSNPSEGRVAYQIRVADERARLRVGSLEPGVLAMVDEEGEVGYAEITPYTPTGANPSATAQDIAADLVGNRAVVWDPPKSLYETHFFGQPIAGRNTREGPLQLSLVEALYLAEEGILDIDRERIRKQGTEFEGDIEFGARARIYRTLREAGAVPKTGFKFGADFRVYHHFENIDNMGHSDVLLRILDRDTRLDPTAIALDVRLAHGVGKRMVFALTEASDSTTTPWLSVTRITP